MSVLAFFSSLSSVDMTMLRCRVVIHLEWASERKACNTGANGTPPLSGNDAPCIEPFCEMFYEEMRGPAMFHTPAESTSEMARMRINRYSFYCGEKSQSDSPPPFRAAQLGASRGVQLYGVPANGTLLFDSGHGE